MTKAMRMMQQLVPLADGIIYVLDEIGRASCRERVGMFV